MHVIGSNNLSFNYVLSRFVYNDYGHYRTLPALANHNNKEMASKFKVLTQFWSNSQNCQTVEIDH